MVMPAFLAFAVLAILVIHISRPDRAYADCMNLFVWAWRKVSQSQAAELADMHLPKIIRHLREVEIEELKKEL
jgi:hypothetical protein